MAKPQPDERSERVTGVSTVAYDVMALLYSRLEGIAAIEDYRLDAQEDDDQEFSALLDEVQVRDSEVVERLRKLLVKRLGSA